MEYYERLQRTRKHGDWRGWLLYFLQGVDVTAQLAAAQITALIALRDTYRARFAGQTAVLALIDALFANPITDAKRAAREMQRSDPTARHAIAASGCRLAAGSDRPPLGSLVRGARDRGTAAEA